MSYVEKLNLILITIEDLMEDAAFVDQLTGEDQGFLDTVWDYFDRVEAELNPQLTDSGDDPILWKQQQDQETD